MEEKTTFGTARAKGVRLAAVDLVGMAGRHGKFATFFVGDDIPALSPGGDSEPLEGEVNLALYCLHVGQLGAQVPSIANSAGYF